ncbi:MAG: primosomal protein N' [Candidatus Omnitrophica bacterium]|nr:primosomal protein N' [Candidatus Omnitrophota bacterium]
MAVSDHSPLTTHHSPIIAEVAFNLPLERAFHYLIPPALQGTLQPGMRVAAPFGPRERVGFVVRVLAASPIRELKTIRRRIDPAPVIADERWALASWLSAYYYCSLGEALAVMVPSALRLPAAASVRAGDLQGERAPHPRGHALTVHQQRAWKTIAAALESSRPQTVLLHGVTASGKTELYLEAANRVLAQGRGVIFLIPEIALTPQTIDRFRERFGERVTVWHSRLTARERAAAWARLSSGRCRAVVGARSAVFAPVRRLGLIVLDEEHEQTYKQEDAPRYHARDVALARARLTRATVILGSATPSIESYYAATHGRGRLVSLPERVEGRGLPTVELIDLREELASRSGRGPLSNRLQRALQQAVERGEQAMLLLNRRGFARVVQCATCGEVKRCERCSVPLVYHASPPALVCHYCNFHEPPEELCSRCRKGYLRFRGSGTERVESELHRLFPASSIARMDRDMTRGRESHRQIYEAVKTHQVGLLVGTQMIAKGLDFPQVTLVGVVSADTALNLPDFRAGERTFDLLTQVAGRAGRGQQPGRVLIQTYCPEHYAIQAARAHDYLQFYQEEIRMRRRLRLPPFVHLIELTLVGSSRQRVDEAAARLAALLRRAARRQRLRMLGPSPHRIPRVRRTYRTRILLKGQAVEPMVAMLRRVLQPGRKFRGLPVIVDVDPL